MNVFTEIVIPAVIIFIANIFSREYGSYRFEIITAVFGWAAGLFLAVWLLITILSFFLTVFGHGVYALINIQKIAFQIFALNCVTFLSRDYERVLKPKAAYFERRIKLLFNWLVEKIKK